MVSDVRLGDHYATQISNYARGFELKEGFLDDASRIHLVSRDPRFYAITVLRYMLWEVTRAKVRIVRLILLYRCSSFVPSEIPVPA